MRLQRIQELVFHRPWLITPSGHHVIREIIARKLARDVIETEQAGFFDEFIVARPKASVENGVGMVHIRGVVGVGLSNIEKTCGNTDLNDLLAEMDQVRADGAERIMLMVDSPGGTVGGVPEAAQAITDSEVPVFAYVPGGAMNASAAYWLTSGADRIYASQSAEIGSIGVYLPWLDQSAALAARGYSIDLIKNKEGDLKGAGYPGTSLTEDQRADFQEGVQEIFDNFAAFVREHRPEGMADDTFRGQTFFGAESRKRKLIDGVASMEAAMRTLRKYKRPTD
jgi:ClpP class serine protease